MTPKKNLKNKETNVNQDINLISKNRILNWLDKIK
jgi:hypothetical protein